MRGRMLRPAMLLAAVGIFASVGLSPATASPAAGAWAQDAPVQGNTVCAPTGGTGTTCTGTYGGDTAWDPNNGVETGVAPSVTVDQTSNLTYQMVQVSWSNFTPSVNDVGAVGFTSGRTEYPVGIYECQGVDPQIGQNTFNNTAPTGNCYTITDQKFATAGVVNAVRTFTQAIGSGSADFQVETSVQNTFLGCNQTVQCSIVVVPNWGGNDVNSDGTVDCTDHSNDAPGFGTGSDLDINIGRPCSWADRIVVPVTFAPTPGQVCPASDNQFTAEGAPAIEQAMNQWRPAWCTPAAGKQLLSFGYNSGVDEYQARSSFLTGGQALTSGTDVALVNQPASADAQGASSRQFTYAPLAVTGISVVYYLDDQQTGLPITNLKLDARLLAKLLTQSYAVQYGQCVGSETAQTEFCDPAVLGNPVSLFSDPEFLALNAPYTAADFPDWNAANALPVFLPSVLAGNSDLTHELTAWIWADPDARAFLEGQPDQWGMHVNSYYKGIGYPISQFLPQDPGWTAAPPDAPLESMQLTWNPVNGLDQVVSMLANDQASALTDNGITCSAVGWTGGPCVGGNWTYPSFTSAAPEAPGSRSLFAIVDQGDAGAFRFPTAQLVNAAGDAVAPTTESMSAAVNDMSTNPDKITQYQNFTAKDPAAYPLTSVEYAMVPTCQLPPSTAQAISGFLTDVAGPAQLYGTALGQLPAFGGYLALDDAQKAQTQTAAAAVNAQTCTSPPPDTTVGGQSGSTVVGSTNNASTANGASPSQGAGPSSANSPSGRPTPGSGQGPIPLGLRSLDLNGFGGWALPIALGIGALLALAAGITYLLTATEIGRSLLRRLRRGNHLPGGGTE